MRKLTFLSIFTVCIVVTNNALGGSCEPVSCAPDSEDTSEMLTTDGKTKNSGYDDKSNFYGAQCFNCDTGGNSECNYNDMVVTIKNGTQALFKCIDDAGPDDSWEKVELTNLPYCSDSPLTTAAPGSSFSVHDGVNDVKSAKRVTSPCRYQFCRNGRQAQNNVCVDPNTSSTNKCPDGKQYGETWTAACSGSSWESVKLHGKDCGARCNSGGDYSIYAITCKDGYTPSDKWDAIAGGGYQACVKTSNGGGGNSGGGTTRPNCLQRNKCASNPNAAECAVCCNVPASVAKWNSATNTCDCVNSNTKFDLASATCVAQGAAPAAFECNTTTLTEISKWSVACAGKPEIIAAIEELKTYCTDAKRTAVGFAELYAKLEALNPQNCEKTKIAEQLCAQISDAQMVNGECKCNDTNKVVDENKKQCVESEEARARREAEAAAAKQKTSKTTIETTFKKLDGINSTFGTSVWKNKEGNFNTARLASDSIAGVVLGTAGGLITSNVVKKNQIKGGFEDINCTIGGQVVSGWGDEFNVGINTSGL